MKSFSTFLALVALTSSLCIDAVLARTHSRRALSVAGRHSRRASGAAGRKCTVRSSGTSAGSSVNAASVKKSKKKPKAKAQPSDPLKSTSFLSSNGIYIGWLPDNGDSGGVEQDINVSAHEPLYLADCLSKELNEYIGQKSFSVGLYGHVLPTEAFDGSELFDLGASRLMGQSGLDAGSVDRNSVKVTKDALFKQVVQSGAVLITSIMPVNGWTGLTSDNNTQAVRIAKALRRYTDAGVVVWNRFAHEANWYNSDSCTEAPGGGKVYLGGPEDVKEAWAVMAAAVKEHAPLVKMYWSPNAGSQEQIEQYAPADKATIDVVGIDCEPFPSTLWAAVTRYQGTPEIRPPAYQGLISGSMTAMLRKR
jgi:hypothetical protein